MNLNNFYILVDNEKKEIIDKFQKLPRNWKNISGLSGLSDEQLENLNWAGHHNLGWINLYSPKILEFNSSEENLQLNKNTLKYLISEKRKEKQNLPVIFKESHFKTDIKTRYTLFTLKSSNKKQINFKCINGYYKFTPYELEKVYNLIEDKLLYLFDLEMFLYKEIDDCKSFSDISKIRWNF
jgi:hypothetical protein